MSSMSPGGFGSIRVSGVGVFCDGAGERPGTCSGGVEASGGSPREILRKVHEGSDSDVLQKKALEAVRDYFRFYQSVRRH